LGEHRQVGPSRRPQALHEELVHIPWLMRWPAQEHAAVRLQGLVQHADLFHTLMEHYGIEAPPHRGFGRSLAPLVRGETEMVRDHLLLTAGQEEAALRTPAWYLRLSTSTSGERVRQLFAKPDDRWEVNEVASRCGDVAERLEQVLQHERQQASAGQYGPHPPLEDALLHGPR
jgi:arylsulfatase A-like enzyme